MAMRRTCPHCGEPAAPVLYGMPTEGAIEASAREELIIGGCDYSVTYPTTGCFSCGSLWTSSDDRSTTAIGGVFAEYFANWKIELPPGAEAAGARGTIRKAGWLINYLFGKDGDGRYIQFYATHRMTDDRHHRIYESGRLEDLDALRSFIVWHPERGPTREEAERKYREHNQRVALELKRLGLYPEGRSAV